MQIGFGFDGAALFSLLCPLVMLGLIGFGIYSAIKAYQRAKLRQAAIASFVAANNLGYIAEDPARARYFTSAPFGVGDSKRARDVVWGTLGGLAFETFAYSYETHTTDSDGKRKTTTHHYQITWVPLPAALPTMRLSADNALLRGLAKLGARDLEVESHEFNQRWKVACDDERIGHAMLTPRMIDRFLQPDLAGRAYTFEGSALMSASLQVSDLRDLPQLVAALHSIVDLIPPFLLAPRDDARGGGSPTR